MFGYDEAVAYRATVTSAFNGVKGGQVVISNASEDSTALVNALLKTGEDVVAMITDEDSEFYGDFITSYASWLKFADNFVVTATGISAADAPEAKVITKAPTVYLTGASDVNDSGFVYTSRVTNTSWNYDNEAMEMMNINVTADIEAADVIVGASGLTEDENAAVKAGTPYIGYGSRAGSILGDALVRESAYGMDCLAYVTYPNTTLVNSSYVMDGDDVLYGYGLGYYTVIPEGAVVLAETDGTREPTEGFIQAITEEQAAAGEAFLNGSVQAIAYNGTDADGNTLNIVLFANTLTNKLHQRDEYAFISNFIFSNLLGDTYVPAEDTVVEEVADTSEIAAVVASRYPVILEEVPTFGLFTPVLSNSAFRG